MKDLPPDHPFYTRGFVIGARPLKGSSKSTEKPKEKPQNSQDDLPTEYDLLLERIRKEVDQEAYEQMKGDSPSDKTEQSPSSTGPNTKDSPN